MGVYTRFDHGQFEIKISNWPWSKRVPFDPSWTNMPFILNKFWSGSSDPTVTSDIQYSLWEKAKKLKIWILFLQWSKCIPINLKGTPKTLNGKSEEFYVPHHSQMWQNYHFWPKKAIWDLKRDHGVYRSCPIFVQTLWYKLLLGYCECILTLGKNKIQIFNFGLSHRLYRGSEVTVGSEDPL